jgi:hypothetical protein
MVSFSYPIFLLYIKVPTLGKKDTGKKGGVCAYIVAAFPVLALGPYFEKGDVSCINCRAIRNWGEIHQTECWNEILPEE